MTEPCLCGAPDCARCFPGSWWHDPDTCDGSDDCECTDPYDVDDYDGDEGDSNFSESDDQPGGRYWDRPYM